jgi:hypothetical protein
LVSASILLVPLLGCDDKAVTEEEQRRDAIVEIQMLGGVIRRDEETSRKDGFSVRLERRPLTTQFIMHLKSFNAPLRLELVDSHVTDAELRQLQVLPSVRSLSLQLDPGVTKEGLRSLVSLTKLEKLHISGGDNVGRGNDYLGVLAALVNLRSLRVDGALATGIGLQSVLQGVPALTELDLQGPYITDESLTHLKTRSDLRKLQLMSPFTDEGLTNLSELRQLESLTLHPYQNKSTQRFPLTDAGLAKLKGLTNLRKLHCIFSEITDDGLRHLEELPELEDLCIFHANLTDAGLEHIKRLKRLNSLNLAGNEALTLKGITKLKLALPQCTFWQYYQHYQGQNEMLRSHQSER